MTVWKIAGFFALLTVVLGLLMRRGSTGARVFREGRVTGVVGRKGHGKTLFGVHEMLRHLGGRVRCRECRSEPAEGRMPCEGRGFVASNLTLAVPKGLERFLIQVDGWSDLLDLPHGTLVLIDEAHLWAPAIQGQQLPAEVRWLLSQCRKLHIEIVWISQHEDRVSLGLRRQTDEIGICKRSYFRQMGVRFYEPENVRKNNAKPDWTFRYRVTRRLAAAYNTYELLKPERSSGVSDPAAVRVRQLADAAPADPAITL